MSRPTSDGAVPFPSDVAEDYRRRGYWEGRTIGSLIWQVADANPAAPALIDGATSLSYSEMTDRADAAAIRLIETGLEPDDRLLVQLPNTWEMIVLTLACFRSGVVPVMALPAHRIHELRHLASLSEARAIAVPDLHRNFDHRALAHELSEELPGLDVILVVGTAGAATEISLAELLEPAPDRHASRRRADELDPDPDSPACFLISGGTTGLPKLITRTHNDYVCNIRATSSVVSLNQDSVYLGTLPAGHNFPLACPGILGTLMAGGTAVMLGSPEPAKAFAAVADHGVTISAVVPAVAQRWIERAEAVGDAGLGTLAVLQVGGSRLPDEFARRVTPALGCTLQQVFGMAEGLINMTRLDDPDGVICMTQGRPVHEADEVSIRDDSGAEVPDGEAGVLYTRGPYTPRGYYRAPEHNATSFVDGWYCSGDIVVRRDDGNLVVLGRNTDMINRGGEKISAEEVESFLYTVPGVEMAAAVAMPDPALGERICAYVVISHGGVNLSLDAIRSHFTERGVAHFKIPERLELVSGLPLTKVGKVDKKALRDDIAARLAAASSTN
jgi:2-hydroxy-7-methoxy-5-methyl-1-naphthoate---CoA ligase